jgi:hypothetical protein
MDRAVGAHGCIGWPDMGRWPRAGMGRAFGPPFWLDRTQPGLPLKKGRGGSGRPPAQVAIAVRLIPRIYESTSAHFCQRFSLTVQAQNPLRPDGGHTRALHPFVGNTRSCHGQ